MSLYELILRSSYAGQECINRWNYLSSGTAAAVSVSFALVKAAGFIAGGEPPVFPTGTLFEKIKHITAQNVEFREIIANNVYDPTDFYTTTFPDNTVGNAGGGDAFQSFIAAGFRTNLVRRDVARGTKRFVGVPSGQVGPNNALNPTYIALMQELADKMTENLTYDDEGNTVTFSPVVCGKQMYTTPPAKPAYRYWRPLATQLEHTAQGIRWEVYDTVRSQTSRQIGKGK